MGYHPRIECKDIASFQTSRSRCSELWFVNNQELEEKILGYAAKYSNCYGVKLYAFAIEGNHIQFPALFPNANRAHFMRDLNSVVARIVPRHQKAHPGGKFWARRYSAEYLPDPQDVEKSFFYTVLQPVQDGLVDDIAEYPGYNCFEDAIWGRARSFKVVRWKQYNDARRWRKKVRIEDFTDTYELRYERLPGYEHLSNTDYVKLMRAKLRERTKHILEQRKGKKALGAKKLRMIKPGTVPRNTKTSTINDHRPRILSNDNERRAQGKAWYFSIYFEYKRVSALYRAGQLNVSFPEGTYKPPLFTVGYSGPMVTI